MVLRLAMICHAATSATRRAAFPAAHEALDDPGLARARSCSFKPASTARFARSPALAAQQTAEALGWSAESVPALRDCDYGSWSGQSIDDVERADPEGVAQWLSDPAGNPHGGEPMTALMSRVSTWLDTQAGSGQVVAVTHASVIKAVVVTVLQAPASALWRVDVAPLSVTRLSRRANLWSLQAMGPGS